MPFERVLTAILDNAFEDAVAIWREVTPLYADATAINDSRLSWNLSARTLEARILYLSLFMPDDERIDDALKRYRAWLMEQVTAITDWTEIGAAPFTLPDNMFVGHDVIDRDHTTLFIMANKVRDALRQHDTKRAGAIASELIDEILDHFDREEAILLEAGYPDAVEHAQYHDQLRQKAGQLQGVINDLAATGKDAIATFDALINFLVNDPVAADTDFRAFFSKQNTPRQSVA